MHNPSQTDLDGNGVGDACDEAGIRSRVETLLVPPFVAFEQASFTGKVNMPISIKATAASLLDYDITVTRDVTNGTSCAIKDPFDTDTTVRCSKAGDYDLTIVADDGISAPVGQLTRLVVEKDDMFERPCRPGKVLRCREQELGSYNGILKKLGKRMMRKRMMRKEEKSRNKGSNGW